MIEALSTRELRKFGVVMAVAVGIFLGLILPRWIGGPRFPAWPWLVASVFLLFAAFAPQALAGFHRRWMKFAMVMGHINSRILLTVLYFTVFLPIGLYFRLTRRDSMERRYRPDADSYRVVREPTLDVKESLRRPY